MNASASESDSGFCRSSPQHPGKAAIPVRTGCGDDRRVEVEIGSRVTVALGGIATERHSHADELALVRGQDWDPLSSKIRATLVRRFLGYLCTARAWRAGIAELTRRARGRSESPAFLLGHKGQVRRIEEFVFYDDIDPNALRNGIVGIDGRRLGDLLLHCWRTGRRFVADIHLHPGELRRSDSDGASPIIAEVGHIAVMIPHSAMRAVRPTLIGVNAYVGPRRRQDHSSDRQSPLHIGWRPWALGTQGLSVLGDHEVPGACVGVSVKRYLSSRASSAPIEHWAKRCI